MTNEEWSARDARIGPLRVAGASLDTIAQETGFARSTVQRRLKALGIPAPKVHPGPKPRAKPPTVSRPLRNLPPPETPNVAYALNLAKETIRRVDPPTLPEADRDDWHSIAYYAALKALQTYQPDRGARWQTWIITQVRWAVLDHLREWNCHTRAEWRQVKSTGERIRERPLSLDMIEHNGEEGDKGSGGRMPEALTVRADPEEWLLAREVRSAVAALPARWRYILQRAEEGYSYAEIGATMGLTFKGVQYLATQAHQRLRHVLAEWA